MKLNNLYESWGSTGFTNPVDGLSPLDEPNNIRSLKNKLKSAKPSPPVSPNKSANDGKEIFKDLVRPHFHTMQKHAVDILTRILKDSFKFSTIGLPSQQWVNSIARREPKPKYSPMFQSERDEFDKTYELLEPLARFALGRDNNIHTIILKGLRASNQLQRYLGVTPQEFSDMNTIGDFIYNKLVDSGLKKELFDRALDVFAQLYPDAEFTPKALEMHYYNRRY